MFMNMEAIFHLQISMSVPLAHTTVSSLVLILMDHSLAAVPLVTASKVMASHVLVRAFVYIIHNVHTVNAFDEEISYNFWCHMFFHQTLMSVLEALTTANRSVPTHKAHSCVDVELVTSLATRLRQLVLVGECRLVRKCMMTYMY